MNSSSDLVYRCHAISRPPRAALVLTLALVACGDSQPPGQGAAPPVTPPPPATLPPSPDLPGPISSSKASGYCAPAGAAVSAMDVSIDGKSGAVLPNGRHVTPAGDLELEVGAAKPFELAVSPDGNWEVTVNSGSPASMSFIGPLNGTATVTRTDLRTVFMGAVFAPDSSRFYLGGGDSGLVWVGDVASRSIVGSVNLNGAEHPLTRPMPINGDNGHFTGAFVTRLALSRDGRRLYALDQAGFAVFAIETAKIATDLDADGNISEPDNFAALLGRTASGRYPFGIALSPDDQELYVSDVGVLAYTALRPAQPLGDDNADCPLCFPVQGYPDDLGEKTVDIHKVDAKALLADLGLPGGPGQAIGCGYVPNDISRYMVPPVGDPNAPESSSVWVYASNDGRPELRSVVRTGPLVGELDEGIKTHAGNHPNAVVVGSKAIYISNGSDDSVSVIDRASLREAARIKLTPLSGYDAVLKGIQPVDLALAPDEQTLYVAEPGFNSIGVIDLDTNRVAGHIPTGWWTSAVGVSADGNSLYATSARGRGSPPFMSSNSGTLGRFHRTPALPPARR